MGRFHFSKDVEDALSVGSGGSVDSAESITSRIGTRSRTAAGASRSGGHSEAGTSTSASSRAGTSASADSATGGGQSDTPVGLLLVENPSHICGGVIGDRSKGIFCTLPAKECSVRSHKETKCLLLENTWHVCRGGKKPAALLKIACRDKNIASEETRQEFHNAMRTPAVWSTVFEDLRAEASRNDARENLQGVDLEVDVLLNGNSDGTVSELGSPSAVYSRAARELDRTMPRSPFVGRETRSVVERTVKVSDLEDLESVDFEGAIPSDSSWDETLGVIIMGWNQVGDNLAKIKEMLKVVFDEHDALSEGVAQDFGVLQAKAQIVESKIHLLKDRIGQDEEASEGGIKTIWTAIAELLAEQSSMGKKVDDLTFKSDEAHKYYGILGNGITDAKDSIAELQKAVQKGPAVLKDLDELKVAIGSFQSEYSKFKSEYERDTGELDKYLVAQNERIDKLEDKSPTSGGRFSRMRAATGGFGGFVPEAEYQDLVQRVSFLERELRDTRQKIREFEDVIPDFLELRELITSIRDQQGSSQGSNTGNAARRSTSDERQRARAWNGGSSDMATLLNRASLPASNPANSSSENSDILESLISEVAFLRSKVSQSDSPTRGSAIEIGGLQFTSVDDCSRFLRRNPTFDVGVLTDPTTAMVGGVDKMRTGKDKADERLAARKTGTTVKTNNVLAAMEIASPPRLFSKGGKGECVDKSDGFGNVADYNQWLGNGVDGFRATVTQGLDKYCKGLLGSIRGDDEGARLARALIDRVKAWWSSFVSFIEGCYTTLKDSAHFTPKAAWNLMGRYARAYFEAMADHRAEAAQLDDPESLEDRATLLWAVLQCHRVTDTFIDLQWEGHPEMVRQTSLFMLTERIDPTKLETIESSVATLNTQVRAATAQVARQETAVTSAVARVTAADERIRACTTKVNDLKRLADNTANDLKQLKNKSK